MRKNFKRHWKAGQGAHGWQRIFVRRNYKDRLFVTLFRDRKALLQLYNGLNGTHYTNAEALEITTIDDVVYMGMKNDCSFMIGSYLNLYEQQSTFCPNMPIRGLIYLADIYRAHIETYQLNLYGRKRIMLPTPKYIVFYNGTEERPDQEELKLSESFAERGGCLEFTATVYNINQGHNQELMEQCSTLAGYSTLIEMVRNYQRAGKELTEAVDAACVYCIEHDILREFLVKNRNEVTRVLLTEYDAKRQRKLDMRDAREEGKAEGKAEGREEGALLMLIGKTKKKLDAGKSVEMIADELEEEVEVIQEIGKEIRKAAEYDPKQIYKNLRSGKRQADRKKN